jgi:hypothetical protein
MITALVKASILSALIIALAYIRWPISIEVLRSSAGLVLLFTIVIGMLTLICGPLLTYIIERCGIGRWWIYTGVASLFGVLVATALGHRGNALVENPHGGFVLSPWTRNSPGIDSFPRSPAEYLASIAFCGAIGAVHGFAYWAFYSKRRGRQKAQNELT